MAGLGIYERFAMKKKKTTYQTVDFFSPILQLCVYV